MLVETGSASPARARLAIAIPAFGRAETIANSIAEMAKEAYAGDLDIAFYVSDDTPDNSVSNSLRLLINVKYPIYYRHNEPSLGHDHNLVSTLLWPNADYVWLLGSGFRVASGKISKIVLFIENQDMIFVNSHSDYNHIMPLVQRDDARALLRNMLWHQTLTGATIYGAKVRDWIRLRGNDLIITKNFPQISIMMGYASDHNPVIGWFGEKALQPAGGSSPSYWSARAVDVFVDDWAAAVTAFPSIVPPDQRTHAIKEHSRQTNLFNTTNLINLRQSGQFRWSSMRQRHFRDAMHISSWKLLAILALPIPVLRAGGRTLAGFKRLVVAQERK